MSTELCCSRTAFTEMVFKTGVLAGAGALIAKASKHPAPTIALSPMGGALFAISYIISAELVEQITSRIFDESRIGLLFRVAINILAGFSAAMAVLSLAGFKMTVEVGLLLLLKSLVVSIVFSIAINLLLHCLC